MPKDIWIHLRRMANSEMRKTKENMRQPLIILGTGGHSKVVADAAIASNLTIAGFLDSDRGSESFFGFPILGDDSKLQEAYFISKYTFAIAIGDPAKRMFLGEKIEKLGGKCPVIIHPSATVSPFSKVEHGAQILSGAVINSDAEIGKFAIVNTSASVDHDCRLSEGVTISPGAHLGGNVKIGRGTFVGIGALLMPNTKIGCSSFICAGSIVYKNISDGMILKPSGRLVSLCND